MAPTEKRSSRGDSGGNVDKKRRKGTWKPRGTHKPADASTKGQRHHAGGRKPRRGGPGMLVTCESGREMKCQREALDILRYYYYWNHGDDNGRESGEVKEKKEEEKDEGMTLEEELEMLRKGASADEVLHSSTAPNVASAKGDNAPAAASSPFAPYETGCKGTVFIMCNLPHCHLISELPPNVSSQKEAGKSSLEKHSTSVATHKRSREESNPECDSGDTKKTKVGEHKPQVADVPAQAEAQAEAQLGTAQVGGENEDHEEAADFTDQEPPWDPLDTLQRVMDDIKGNDANAPSSRFITRMIPIQATCFASQEEIRNTSQRLLERFLLKPAQERSAQERSAQQTPTGDSSKDIATPVTVTFQIAFKRRNCSNVRREEIIRVVGDVVRQLGKDKSASGKEQTGEQTKSCTKGDAPEKSSPPHVPVPARPVAFDVDLKDPDYTIQIEVCKTLCGMSVIPRCGEFDNFNIYQIRQKQKQDHDDGEAAG